MKETLKLGGILLLITGVCAGLLGLVNSVTKPLIDQVKIEKTNNAIKALIPDATQVITLEGDEAAGVLALYTTKKGDAYAGTVAKVAPNGYGGAIELMVGIDASSQITGIQILTHAETPGLGANAQTPGFSEQYKNKGAGLVVSKTSTGSANEIVAITGATITSQAVTDGVNLAVDYVVANEATLKEAK